MANHRGPTTSETKSHISGFHVAYDHKTRGRERETKVDIIAIHGIGAKSITTWTHWHEATRENAAAQPAVQERTNWLSDSHMLPSLIPNSRVMLYGYESDWKGGNAIQNTIYGLASNFVAGLRQVRKGVGYRPIIFVAHCFGGIVFMKAMTRLRNQDRDMLRCVIGCIFLGTPFNGVNGSLGDGTMVEHWINQGQPVQPEILKLLEPDNSHLYEILQEFISIGNEALSLPSIDCFYETKSSDLARLRGRDNMETKLEIVVKTRSATFPGSEPLGMERDHFAMNKFYGPHDPEYIKVTNSIVELVHKAHSMVEERCLYEVRGQVRESLTPRDLGSPSHTAPDIALPARTRQQQYQHIVAGASPLPIFHSGPWRERDIPPFQTLNHTYKTKLKGIKHGSLARKRPFGCGVASDGGHVFTFDEKRLTIFDVPTQCTNDPKKSRRFEAPSKFEFHTIKMTEMFVAAIVCTLAGRRVAILLYKFPSFEQIWTHSEPTGLSDFQCSSLAIRELSDCVLVAIGKETSSAAKVEVYRINRTTSGITGSAGSLRAHIDLPLGEPTEKLGKRDPAKLLELSADGTFLVCCTREHDRVLVWRIAPSTRGSPATQLCNVVRPFNLQKDVLGVTSAKCWGSARGHPYILVTTSPGSQRAHGEGEWSFIAPASDPFPPYSNAAFDGLLGAQTNGYFSIVQAAVTMEGDAIALMSMRGNICVMSLKAGSNGGIRVVEDKPVQLREGLNSGLRPREAGLAFTGDGKSLVAVDNRGALVVAKFDNG